MLWYNPYCGVFGELKWFDIIAIVEFLENYTFREWRGKESTLELHTLRTVNSMTRKTSYLLSSHGKTKKEEDLRTYGQCVVTGAWTVVWR